MAILIPLTNRDPMGAIFHCEDGVCVKQKGQPIPEVKEAEEDKVEEDEPED